MNEAYLCLGGNLGNCAETFNRAITLLEKQNTIILTSSSVYISEAWGMEKAPDFYNQVIRINTALSAQKLMDLIFKIEHVLGRERTDSTTYQSRTIDIDILFFNEEIIKTGNLEIPHPRLHLRRFVLEPMHEIAPSFVHPFYKKTITELLEICPDKTNVTVV